jgi:ligand-binding sensor domain-containing protein/two-component sensor histidine kinase
MVRQLHVTFLTLIFLSTLLYSQKPDITFRHLSIEDGLSQSTVEAIIQDQAGFMWFGTEDGLNRYDGYKFTVYKHDPDDPNSISSNNIWCLWVDSNNYLWIGTFTGGLNRFDPKNETFTRYHHNPEDPHSISSDNIRSISEDVQGNLWIGTRDRGINILDPESHTFSKIRHDPENINSLLSNDIRFIYPNSNKEIWIATSNGLSVYKLSSHTFKNYQNKKGDSNSLSHNSVRHIYKDRSGIFWIATANGLNSHDPQTNKFINFLSDPNNPTSISGGYVRKVYEDPQGRLWMAIHRGGLNIFDREKNTFYKYQHENDNPNSLGNNSPRVFYQDKGGLLWVGTMGAGLNIYDPRKNRFKHYRHNPGDSNSLSHPIVWAISQGSEGDIWFGTHAGGLNRFDPKTQMYTRYLHNPSDPFSISSNNVRVITKDQQGNFWIGSRNGSVNYLETKKQLFRKFTYDPDISNSFSGNTIRAIYEDQSGALWFCTWGGGFNHFDRNSTTFTNFGNQPDNPNSLSSNNVVAIYQDRQGVFWVGTSNGLNRVTFPLDSANLVSYQLSQPQFTRFYHDPSDPNSLSNSYILSIHEGQNGDLWFGTMLGLSRLQKKNRDKPLFARYFMKDGLPNDVVYGILEDSQSNLWLSTNNGLSRFDPESEIFKNYDIRDGLQSNEFNTGCYTQTNSGSFIFGGVNGATEFFPDSLTDSPFIPPVVLTAFNIFDQPARLNQTISRTEKIILSHKDNFFSFEFAALDFSKPDRNRYAYMLEGFDEDWINAGTRRFAGYTKVDPGEYLFKVKGTNGDGVWNEAGTSIKITITPPFWKTWWFMLLSILAVGGGISLAIVARIKQLLKIERLRSKIAADLHDDIGAGLTEISIMGEVIASKTPEPAKNIINSDLQKIGDTSRNLIDSMSDIVWLVNPRRDSLFDLVSRLGNTYTELLNSTDIHFKTENLESLKNVRLNMEYRQHLFMIFKEAINNCLKYSEGKEVFLKAVFRRKKLKIQLIDDGKGFDMENTPCGNGIENMKSRAKIIGGSLKVTSQIGKGTIIEFEGNI